MYLLGNGKLITRDVENPYFECGGVVIRGSSILELGDFEIMRKKISACGVHRCKRRHNYAGTYKTCTLTSILLWLEGYRLTITTQPIFLKY